MLAIHQKGTRTTSRNRTSPATVSAPRISAPLPQEVPADEDDADDQQRHQEDRDRHAAAPPEPCGSRRRPPPLDPKNRDGEELRITRGPSGIALATTLAFALLRLGSAGCQAGVARGDQTLAAWVAQPRSRLCFLCSGAPC